MHLSLHIGRTARTPEERAFRHALRRHGYTLPPHRRPGPLWTPWVNRALRTSAEVDQAVAEIEACGLAPHKDRAKNWDLLVALGTILGRTNTRAAVLEMGAAGYSRLLPWLYAYGYRRLVGIDLLPVVLKHPTMVDYRTMDLTATSFPDGAFDAIGCLSVIEHGVSPEGFAREAGRLLRPGGVAVLSTDFWCEPLDVAGRSAYGVPVHVLTPDDIGTWIEAAARHGLQPVAPTQMDCVDRVVRWERIDLDFTFANVVLVKGGWSRWSPWPRAGYRRSAAVPSAD
jgi:SAM-dependent methyltransferase